MAKAFKRRCTEVMVHDFSGDTMKMLPVCEMKQCANPRATNCHLYHYAGNNPVRYVDPDGNFPTPKMFYDMIEQNLPYKNLSDAQWDSVKMARDRAVTNLGTMVKTLRSCNNDTSRLDSRMTAIAQCYIHSELGSLPLDWSELANRLEDIKTHLESLERYDFTYDAWQKDTYAYTFPLTKRIWLCKTFFAADDCNGRDNKEGTLIHEVTHNIWVLGTFDLKGYIHDDEIDLPDEGIKTKQSIANNWEHFYEMYNSLEE